MLKRGEVVKVCMVKMWMKLLIFFEFHLLGDGKVLIFHQRGEIICWQYVDLHFCLFTVHLVAVYQKKIARFLVLQHFLPVRFSLRACLGQGYR